MLIKFCVKNYLSFSNKIEFTTIATAERQHRERLIKDSRMPYKIVPISAIYGGNASGKSNFLKAISFAKNLINNGTKPEHKIDVEPFRLDDQYMDKPSEFSFEIKTTNDCYSYGFTVTKEKIHSEWLNLVTKTSEKKLFFRDEATKDINRFDLSFFKNKLSPKDFQVLEFNAIGTRANQLFLTESIQRNMDIFRDVYDWFSKTLTIIYPETVARRMEFLGEEEVYKFCNMLLQEADTGVNSIQSEELSVDSINIPEVVKNFIKGQTTDEFISEVNSDKGRFAFKLKDGNVISSRLFSYHLSSDKKKEIRFETSEESQGTKRLIDLLPAFYELSTKKYPKVYLIDEINRSMHHLLTRGLIEFFLSTCKGESGSQLIFTTHDLLLMDQDLMRRDEMWILERNERGETDLLSLSDFKNVRYDKNLLKSYLLGRFGGIPHIRRLSTLEQLNRKNQTESN